MCGIVGYIGGEEALPFLLQGLKRLEYRGYDSAGVALLDGTGLHVAKTAGRISELERRVEGWQVKARVGIGHTRWATHGRPSDVNAHPHTSCASDVAVAHNGIIENWQELKAELTAKGHVFRSETDTEVIAHLVEEHLAGDLPSAVAQAVGRLEGSFALAVIASQDPGHLVAARKDSPLVIGLGDGVQYLASDIPAILGHTRRALIVEDGELAVLTPSGVTLLRDGMPVERRPFEVTWDLEAAEKGGHPHFMLKEIMEQPKAIRDTLTGKLNKTRDAVVLPGIETGGVRKVYLVACGTSYHAGLVGRQLLQGLAKVPTEAELASEFRYGETLMARDDLFVAISQSGETADTLAALREAKRQGVRTLAITNVVGSSIYREADMVLPTAAGPEIAVASSKAYTTQLLSLALLAAHFAAERGLTVPQSFFEELYELPAKVDAVLGDREPVLRVAKRIQRHDDVFFIGRGLDYAVAMEGQLKLKEISYIHAEALPAGELKHGTLALIEEGVPVVAVLTQEALLAKALSNVAEVKARGGWVFAVARKGFEVAEAVDEVVYLPPSDPRLMPILAILPLQLLAYHVAVARGNDVDKPRNLAKSVTVE